MNDLSKACLDEAKNSMQSSLNFLEKELSKIRAGKANPAMLDGVKVDYYGTPTEISQVANINTPDARSIVVQPWEKNMVAPINKAIMDANLGFTPRQEGDMLRIIIPPLTEERRRELSKAAKTEIENAKVNVRNVRRNVMDKVKKLKDKSVPEDEVKQVEKELQDITDKHIAECDKIFAAKEKEIMSI
ncbi:MAG: ribosome recycling factor [Bacteroidales bacterium]|nr:ribosome recycling factor [Bacteroidales bacterium]